MSTLNVEVTHGYWTHDLQSHMVRVEPLSQGGASHSCLTGAGFRAEGGAVFPTWALAAFTVATLDSLDVTCLYGQVAPRVHLPAAKWWHILVVTGRFLFEFFKSFFKSFLGSSSCFSSQIFSCSSMMQEKDCLKVGLVCFLIECKWLSFTNLFRNSI